MTQTVYIDVLFAINLFVNYFLLLATVKIMKQYVKRRRILAGAALGALYALTVFYQPDSVLLSVAAKLLFSVTVLLAVFGFVPVKMFIKTLCAFFLVNFGFGGIMFLIWVILSPPGMVYRGGVVYFPLSPLFLAAATLLCYLIIRLVSGLSRLDTPDREMYRLSVSMANQMVHLNALLDTGNSLIDPFSGMPVIIAEYGEVEKLLPREQKQSFLNMEPREDADREWSRRYRVIPFSDVSGKGVLPAFKPDRVVIRGAGKTVATDRVYIGVCSGSLSGGQYKALINPNILTGAG